MAASAGKPLYNEVVEVTHVYLGPAAERFIGRQVEHHLHKPPAALSTDDLLKLITWLRIAISVLTDDKTIVEEYVSRLNSLAHKR